MKKIYIVRHGETEWTESRRHTGLTDIPLTDKGREQAKGLPKLEVAKVYCSPLVRAKETCELSGHLEGAEIDPDLVEWDYGDYEGLKTLEIREKVPGWNLFKKGVPNGESFEQVSQRADRVIERCLKVDGDVAVFSSGHFSRCLGARWMELPIAEGRHLLLSTASISVLSFDREERAIALWNARSL